jgi:2-polyprenyl-3-methyl-5-hydroxy-6-metoxy-1,4-benzoquinol methylase
MEKYSDFIRLRKVRDDSVAKTKNYFSEGGRPDYAYFARRACPVCGRVNNNVGYKFKNDSGNTFVECRGCRMVYMDPILKKEIYLKYYLQSATATAKKQNWDDSIKALRPLTKPLASRRYDLLLRHTRRGILLDFGCGFGKVADTLKFYFDKIEGIEIDKFCADVAREVFNLEVYNDFIKNLNIEQKYDACIMYNSIEHLLDPKDTLIHIRCALKDRGKLFIECPNSESISLYLFRGKHHLAQSSEHVNLFSLTTLARLLRETGFGIVEKKTRKIDIIFNDLLTWLLKRPGFYHRCSGRLINSRHYDNIVKLADKIIGAGEPLFLKFMRGRGSYSQIVAVKR